MFKGLSGITALVAPVALVLLAAASLYNLVSLLRLVGQVAATKYSTGVMSYVHPAIVALNKVLLVLFGEFRTPHAGVCASGAALHGHGTHRCAHIEGGRCC